MITAKDFSSVGHRPVAGRCKPVASALPAPPAASAAPVPPAEPSAAPDDKAEIARLRETLQRSEEFSRALLSTVSDLIFELRKDGLILSFHAPKDNEFALTAEAVVGRRLMELLTTSVGQLAMHYLEKAFRTGAAQTFSCQYLLHGKLRYFETRIALRG